MSLTYPVTYCRIFSVSPSINLLPFVPCPFFPSLRSRKNRRPDDDGIIIGSITVETVLRFLSSGRIRFEKIKRAGYVAASTSPFPFRFFLDSLSRKRKEEEGEKSGTDRRFLWGIIRLLFFFFSIRKDRAKIDLLNNLGKGRDGRWESRLTNPFSNLFYSGDAQRQGRKFSPRFSLSGEGVGGVRRIRPSSSRRRNVPAGQFQIIRLFFPFFFRFESRI